MVLFFRLSLLIAIYCIRVSSQAHSVPHLDMAGLDRKEEGGSTVVIDDDVLGYEGGASLSLACVGREMHAAGKQGGQLLPCTVPEEPWAFSFLFVKWEFRL